MKQPKLITSILMLVATTINSGCAINVNPWGQINFGFDQALISGKEQSSFTLPDGGSVTLRKLKNNYSIKIDRYFRVIEIGPGQKARILSTTKVGDYTLVWVEKQLNDCSQRCLYSTVLIAVNGFEVKVWEINGEDDVPYITVTPAAAAIDVPGVASAGKLKRYVFSNGHLYNQGFVEDSPPQYTRAEITPTTTKNASSTKPGQYGPVSNSQKSYAINKSLVFSTEEKIKPVMIYLDKR